MPFCENCGNKVSDISKFCSNCGEIIDHVIQEEKMGSSDLDESQSVNNKNNTIEPLLHELLRYKGNDIIFDQEGHAVAELDGKWGVINNKFEWVLAPEFEELGDYMLGRTFDEKGYLNAKKNDKWGFINRQGEWVIQPLFFLLGLYDKEDFCQAYTDNKFGWIDRKGNWLIEPIFDYDHVDFFDSEEIYIQFDKYHYCKIYSYEKYGFIDRKGNWKIPPKFDLLGKYDDFNYCHAKSESKYGFIDRLGKWIIKPDFEALGYFDDQGFAIAILGENSGFIDRKGNLQVHPKFELNYFKSNTELVYFDYEGCLEGKEITVSNCFDRHLESFFRFFGGHKVYWRNFIPREKIEQFSLNFDFEFLEKCKFLVYYDDTFWGKGDKGYAIVEINGTIYFLFSNKLKTKIYLFVRFNFIYNFNNEISVSINFEEFDRSNLIQRIEFFNNEILSNFSDHAIRFHKEAIDNLKYFLSATADLQLVSENGHDFVQSNIEQTAGIKYVRTSQIKPKDSAGIR